MSTIWGNHTINENRSLFIQLGDLRIWGRLVDAEVLLTYDISQTVGYSADEPPSKAIWQRWRLDAPEAELTLAPAFPARPLVIDPQTALRLPATESLVIYPKVPVWVRVISPQLDPATLLELPTRILSNTWFGDFTSGDLCYHVSSKARSTPKNDPDETNMVMAPVRISNESDSMLNIDKFCLRVGLLNIYGSGNELWTDESWLVFRGSNSDSQYDVISESNILPGDRQVLATAKDPLKKRTTGKSIATFKDLPGVGISIS